MLCVMHASSPWWTHEWLGCALSLQDYKVRVVAFMCVVALTVLG